MPEPATTAQLEKLRPYLCGQASPAGEVDSYCPLHEDRKRSAQINIKKGLFFCNAGCGGMRIDQLIAVEGYWLPANRNGDSRPFTEGEAAEPEPEPISISEVRRWHESLMADEDGAGSRLHRLRGIDRVTMIRFELGWDGLRRVFTIPVKSAKGKLWNIRRYDPTVSGDRRKIWGLRGRNKPKLFPAVALRSSGPIIICEGEWDALLTIQNGFPAITRTGAAHVWKPKWSQYFTGRDVYLCHDMDTTGEIGNDRVAGALETVAASVQVITLPYEYSDKHGKDLTDFWLENHKPVEFAQLMKEAA